MTTIGTNRSQKTACVLCFEDKRIRIFVDLDGEVLSVAEKSINDTDVRNESRRATGGALFHNFYLYTGY